MKGLFNIPFSRTDRRTFIVRPSNSISSYMRHPYRKMAHRSVYLACGLLLCLGLLHEMNTSREGYVSEDDLTKEKVISNDVQVDGVEDQDSLQQLNEQIKRIKGLHDTHSFTHSGYAATFQFEQIHTTSFKPSTKNVIRFREPNTIQFEFKDAAAVIEGKFAGKSGIFSVSGIVRGDLKNVTATLTTNVQIMPDNQAKVTMNSCSTAVGSSKFTIDASGPIGTILKNFEGMMNEQTRLVLPAFLCDIFAQAIQDKEYPLFDQLLMKKPKKPGKTGLFYDFQDALESCPVKICNTLRRRYAGVYYAIKTKAL